MANIQTQILMTLRPKPLAALGLLLGCAVFVAVGVWMVVNGEWLGYLIAALFALGIGVAIIQLLPGSTYLQITNDGLKFANFFRVTTIPWHVVERFFVVGIKQTGVTVHEIVGFNFVASYDRAKWGRRINSTFVDCEAALPNTYGRKAEELAELLNECLTQFREATESTSS